MPLVKLLTFLFLLFAADLSYAANAMVNVSATVLRINNCKFNTGGSTLNLGVLDPETPFDRTITTSLIFKCSGSDSLTDFSISDDSGLSETGSDVERKMRHSSMPEAYIPYGLSLNKAYGEVERGMDQSLTISIKVKGTDYREVYSGGYSDVVYISVTP